jgi:hypothetical protein
MPRGPSTRGLSGGHSWSLSARGLAQPYRELRTMKEILHIRTFFEKGGPGSCISWRGHRVLLLVLTSDSAPTTWFPMGKIPAARAPKDSAQDPPWWAAKSFVMRVKDGPRIRVGTAEVIWTTQAIWSRGRLAGQEEWVLLPVGRWVVAVRFALGP